MRGSPHAHGWFDMTIKVKPHLEQDPNALALGLLLNDYLLFGRYFMRGDISEEPTVPQKLMLLDNSQRILMATSRFVLKTVGLIIRMLQDIVTHLKPVYAGQQDEILFTTPTEGHLQPTVSRLYSIIYNNIAFRSLVAESRSGDKPELVIRSQLKFFFRIDGTCLSGDSTVVDADTGVPYTLRDMDSGILPNSIHVLNMDTFKLETTSTFEFVNNGLAHVFRLTLRDGSEIKATANHPFYTQDGWKCLDQLSPEDRVATPMIDRLTDGDIAFIGVKSIEPCGEEAVYDIRVPVHHNFIANRIIVHNSGTDINMVNIHPKKIYADEQAWGIMNTHRSRLAALHPGGQVVYAGVPNDIRTSPFYALDTTKDGGHWSKHKMSVLKANPKFLHDDAKTKRHIRLLIKEFGGRNSPEFKTQILGEWGDEASRSFPPGSIAWFNPGAEGAKPYHITILSGQQVKLALRQGLLPMELKITHVRPRRACIGWDYGYSPDTTTFLVAIQIGNDPVWYTYCRISLYQTDLDSQTEVLKYLVTGVLDNRVAMVSTDSQVAYQKMIGDAYAHIFREKCKLSNPGGQVEMDLETGEFIPDEMRNELEIIEKRRLKKTVYQGRKYYMTTLMRKMMSATLTGAEDYPRLMLGYDSELENELAVTIERKTEKRVVYDLPRKGRTVGRVTPDQIVDACRYLCDAIISVDAVGFKREPDWGELVGEMGWTGRRLPFGARLPFD